MNFKKALSWMLENPNEVLISPGYTRYRWSGTSLQYFDMTQDWMVAGFHFSHSELNGPWRKEMFHQDDPINVIRYCLPRVEQMWAAHIISLLLHCDFRDSKHTAEEFLKELEGDN